MPADCACAIYAQDIDDPDDDDDDFDEDSDEEDDDDDDEENGDPDVETWQVSNLIRNAKGPARLDFGHRTA